MSFDVVKLAEVASFIMGQAPPGKSVNVLGQGTPFYRSGEFGKQRPLLQAWTTNPLRLSNSSHVWVCVVGANAGEVNRGADGAIGRSVAAVVPGSSLDSQFLFYCLKNSEPWLRNRSAGSVQAVLSKNDLGELEIPLVSLAEQKAIASMLGALDEKIESNRRIQRTIENLMRALVNRALKLASSGFASLADYCNLVKDMVSVSQLDAQSHYISFEHMPKGSISLNEWGLQSGLASSKSRFSTGDVLFGKLRPYFKKVGLAPVEGVCSNDILVLRPKSPSLRAFIAVVASSDELIDYVSAAATGTRMPRASWADVAKWVVPKLSMPEIERLGELTEPLVDKLLRVVHENRRLVELREALLPELVSGRIRLGEFAA